MLRQRIGQVERTLERRMGSTGTRVKALRRLLVQLGNADPFPLLGGEDYLLAFAPWMMANAERFPRWALEYAFRVSGLGQEVSRWVERMSAPRPLKSAQDVVALLEAEVAALRAGEGSVERARAVGYLVGLARQAIETGVMAARLESLEQILKQRTKENAR